MAEMQKLLYLMILTNEMNGWKPPERIHKPNHCKEFAESNILRPSNPICFLHLRLALTT